MILQGELESTVLRRKMSFVPNPFLPPPSVWPGRQSAGVGTAHFPDHLMLSVAMRIVLANRRQVEVIAASSELREALRGITHPCLCLSCNLTVGSEKMELLVPEEARRAAPELTQSLKQICPPVSPQTHE